VVLFLGKDILTSFLGDRPDWKSGLFLAPFLMVGLALVKRSVYSFLAMFSPQPTISLSTATIALGDTVELRWDFVGNTRSLRSLEICLQGAENTYEQCGGQRQAMTDTFTEIPIIERTGCHPSGHASVTFPADTRHSAEADDQEISWSVNVFADVWPWPDVAVGFPVAVLPQHGAVNESAIRTDP
jgi:hypothetical protein